MLIEEEKSLFHEFVTFFTGFEFIKEIILIIIGVIIGSVSTWIWNYFKKKLKIYLARNSIKKLKDSYSQEGIVSISNAYPCYDSKNIIFKDSGEKFFLAFPDNYENTFNCRDKDILFSGKSLKQLGEEMAIPNFVELIEKHKTIVANEFINSSNSGRRLFNNEKFGIRSIIITKTDNKDENDVVNISFFLTDYYTHKVMRSIYHELQNANTPFFSSFRVEDIVKYYPFLTSFGIDSLLILSPPNEARNIVVVKRSKYMANMKKDMWHVSMNEGLSTTDCDAVSGKVNIYQSVIRGYLEELGISYNNHNIYNEFRDIFIVKENFELGITSFAEVNMTLDDLKTCFNGAEDSSMETTGEFDMIPYASAEIKKYISQHHNDMTSICKYCLEMCRSRLT